MSADASLRGNLRDFGIGEVFQLIGQQRKTGVLEIAEQGRRAQIAFDRGAVVRAATVGPHEDAALGDLLVRVGFLTPGRLVELERERDRSGTRLRDVVLAQTTLRERDLDEVESLLTRETVFEVLRLARGQFHFVSGPVGPSGEHVAGLPAEQILMDGLRMVDEWRTFDEAATREGSVFRRTGSFEAYREASAGEPSERLAAAERLFWLVDGRASARRVIDLSRLGTFEGARLLSRMRAAGVIEPRPGSAARAASAAALRSPGRGRGAALARAALAAGLPFALLAAVALLAARAPAPAAAPPGARPLPRAAAPLAEDAFATLRWRHRLRAHRFDTGRWPPGLGALARAEGARERALTPSGERPYYEATEEGGAVVLAPRR